MEENEARSAPVDDPQLEEKLHELDILKQSLEEKKKLADEYYEQLLRLKAEFGNYRKRFESEKQTMVQFGKEDLIFELLAVLDNFNKASDSARKNVDPKLLLEGIELIHKLFRDILSKEGLKPIETAGRKFDPEFHHAVESRLSDEHEEGYIIQELQTGYIFKDRVIRPAMVAVAKREEEKKGLDEDEGE